MEIQYIGESLFPGELGHILCLLAFVSSILSAFSFYFASEHRPILPIKTSLKSLGCLFGVTILYHLFIKVFIEDGLDKYLIYEYYYLCLICAGILVFLYLIFRLKNVLHDKLAKWRQIGSWAYYIHFISALGVIGTLFYLINGHHFEYEYVYNHTSKSLPVYYQLSSFWEGQEGSFLLWIFWQVIIGFILLRSSGSWKNEVMTIFCVIQAFLSSMVIGVYLGDYHIGSSPFVLFREVMPEMPLFSRPDYLMYIKDGNGLNPLLQNYWMVIHPPTLFLGFSLLSIPFVYVIAALWKKEIGDWVKKVIPWVVAGGMVLGTGILMGATWAYEALSFGGYWAWDPVENASLVPWIILMAGLHTLLIYKSTKRSLRTTMLFFMLAFILILYSTFLTRSGVLGDASVHSFTGEGMLVQLLLFLLTFTFFGLYSLIYNWKRLSDNQDEEAGSSREFWMFIGSLVLLISALQIILYTSIPVVNKLLPTSFAPPGDPIPFYNKWQIGCGIVIVLLSAIGLYLKFKKTAVSKLLKEISIYFLMALIMSAIIYYYFPMSLVEAVFLIGLTFSIVSNLFYVIFRSKNLLKSGAALTHFGFAVLMLGILISSGQQDVVSLNRLGVNYGEGYDEKANYENILLYKDMPMQMGEYTITYRGDSVDGLNHYYKVSYEHRDIASFDLFPYVQDNPKFGRSANPDTRHFWNKDLFTHITSVSNTEVDADKISESEQQLSIGDSVFTNRACLVIDGIKSKNDHPDLLKGDIGLQVHIRAITPKDTFHITPISVVRSNYWVSIKDSLPEIGLEVSFLKFDPETERLYFKFREWDPPKDFVIMKAIMFPHINVVWLGSMLMIIGFAVSLYNRIKQDKS